MEASVGDFVRGDILIQGKKITAVGANLKVSGPVPRIVDASNTILIPGFVDCHRHSWEGVLRRIIPKWRHCKVHGNHASGLRGRRCHLVVTG